MCGRPRFWNAATLVRALVLCAVGLLLSSCAPLIERAPRAGADGDSFEGATAGVTTSTSTPSSISQAPPLLGELPEPAEDGGGWRTLAVTRGGDTRVAPSADDHYVVWQGRDSRSPDVARHDEEIYLYDLLTGETSMLSDDDRQDVSPQIEGDWVVWLRYADGGAGTELVAHRLTSGDTRVLASDVAGPGTSGPPPAPGFVLAGGGIVWTAGAWPDTEIHHYDLHTSTETVVSDGRGRNRSPDTDGSWVVWLSQTGEGEAVMLAHPSRGLSRAIADVTPGQAAPQVDSGLVVWSGWDGADTEIFLSTVPDEGSWKDPVAPVRLTDDSVDDVAPRIDGGMVVWREGSSSPASPSPTGDPSPAETSSSTTAPSAATASPSRVVLYEYGVDKKRVLAVGVGADAFPDVRGGLVFWTTPGSVGEGFVLYDAASEQTVDLGRKVVGSGYPVDGRGGRLVWSGWEGAAPQIFMAYRGIRPVTPFQGGLKVSFGDTAGSRYAVAIESLVRADVFTPPALPAGDTTTTAAPPLFHPETAIVRDDAMDWIGAVVGPLDSTGDAVRPLTRGQFVSLVVRALRANHPGALRLLPVGLRGTVQYVDPVHGEDLLLAEYNRLPDGLSGFSFDWDAWRPAARGEAAQILSNAMDLLREVGASGTVPTPPAADSGGILAAPALSVDQTTRAFREKATWRLGSAELRLGEVQVSEDPRGLQTVRVTFEATRPDAPAPAVGEFIQRAMGGAAGIASVLNRGRGAQIGTVRVYLNGLGGLTLVSHTNDLQESRQTLKWDPSVEEAVRAGTAFRGPLSPSGQE